MTRKPSAPRPTKICPICQRPFQNRKTWEQRGIWEDVIYCSERCRREAKRQRLSTKNSSRKSDR